MHTKYKWVCIDLIKTTTGISNSCFYVFIIDKAKRFKSDTSQLLIRW